MIPDAKEQKMKLYNRIALVTVALALVLALCACGEAADASAPDGMKLVEGAATGYSLYVPQSWTVDMSTGVVSAYASSVDRANISFTGFALTDRAATLDSFWNEYAGDFKSTFGDSMYYYDAEGKETTEPFAAKTTLGGFEANKYVYRAKVTGEVYKFMQVTCIAAGTVYIFTYTAVLGNYDAHIAEINDILNNFRFN